LQQRGYARGTVVALGHLGGAGGFAGVGVAGVGGCHETLGDPRHVTGKAERGAGKISPDGEQNHDAPMLPGECTHVYSENSVFFGELSETEGVSDWSDKVLSPDQRRSDPSHPKMGTDAKAG
jgi:hypothetical protein